MTFERQTSLKIVERLCARMIAKLNFGYAHFCFQKYRSTKNLGKGIPPEQCGLFSETDLFAGFTLLLQILKKYIPSKNICVVTASWNVRQLCAWTGPFYSFFGGGGRG
jgi:hypothetical protein